MNAGFTGLENSGIIAFLLSWVLNNIRQTGK